MRVRKEAELRFAGPRIAAVLTWLGGGRWPEAGEHHEQSTDAVAGVLVLVNAAVAWLVATLAGAESARWPIPYVLPLSLVFGVLVGAITRAVAAGPTRSWRSVMGRGAVAVAVGVAVSELAALVLFSGSIDRRLDEQAARNAGSTPAVAQASANLQQTRDERRALDRAVDEARAHRDQALVVARCEYHPTPACPQTRITGVPGVGPETRTSNELLADAQRELDNTVAIRDREAPALDVQIDSAAAALTQARQNVIAGADHGLGARWVAMQDFTLSSAGALLLRLLALAFFTMLSLLPLILHLWRGETTDDRRSAARAERDHAELAADTAIAVKRAEVRAAAEMMWADQQLARARLAVEAQTEIDRAQQHRRVAEALEAPAPTKSQRVDDDIFLPIAAEAEAASRAATELPPEDETAPVAETANLPAAVEPNGSVEPHEARTGPTIPTIPDVTKAAARWIRPLVPTFVARAIDTTSQPLRSARQIFEEVEEVTFSFKRTRKVTLNAEESVSQRPASAAEDGDDRRAPSAKPERMSISDNVSPDVPLQGRQQWPELTGREGPSELRADEGPRRLPPA
ncbi:MAG: DUF4407 domain-containing protein [Mycobacterium sp.]|nr:DUF4407 domain-containing protein [Mycobacterium sp.]